MINQECGREEHNGQDTDEINLRFVAHESYNGNILVGWIGTVDQCRATVNVVSAEAIHHSLDGFQSTFVQDKVTRKNMD